MPHHDPFTAEQVDDALTAMIAFNGNAHAAIRYLESVEKRAPSPATMYNWSRVKYWQRYEELREKIAQPREDTLANDYLDAARSATEVMMLAVEKAKDRLESGKDEDPARTAANLARASQSAVDKRLALQGRPSQITETRDIGEILRSLASKGIGVQLASDLKPAQLESGD